jgi:hypothetical protein
MIATAEEAGCVRRDARILPGLASISRNRKPLKRLGRRRSEHPVKTGC